MSQRLKNQTNLPGDQPAAMLGTYNSLKWKGFLTTTYNVGRSHTTLTTRCYGPGTHQQSADDLEHGLSSRFQPRAGGLVF